MHSIFHVFSSVLKHKILLKKYMHHNTKQKRQGDSVCEAAWTRNSINCNWSEKFNDHYREEYILESLQKFKTEICNHYKDGA